MPNKAGTSSIRIFRRERRRRLRQQWRFWSGAVVFIAATITATFFTHGFAQVVFAGIAGATIMLLVVGWMLGGDVHLLTWVWGREGERATEEMLAELNGTWSVHHDIEREHGNWDHVVVGPPGVFLLDSKNLAGTVFAGGDALRAGRTRFDGRVFRGAAIGLKEAIEGAGGGTCWISAVVVVWGEFPGRCHEERNVTYVHGRELVNWLLRQPARLSERRREQIAAAVSALSQAA